MLLAVLVLALACSAEAAVPKPRLRPVAEAPPPQRSSSAIPIPRLRPPRPEAGAPETALPPAPEEPPGTREERAGWSAAEVAAAKAACGELAGLDIAYEPLEPIGAPGACGAAAPIKVKRIAGVALVPEATLTCPMAAALHGWISKSVKPAAERRLNTGITEIRTATSYACRRRNNSSSGKMSEHSKANALDMAGFTFAETASRALKIRDLTVPMGQFIVVAISSYVQPSISLKVRAWRKSSGKASMAAFTTAAISLAANTMSGVSVLVCSLFGR